MLHSTYRFGTEPPVSSNRLERGQSVAATVHRRDLESIKVTPRTNCEAERIAGMAFTVETIDLVFVNPFHPSDSPCFHFAATR